MGIEALPDVVTVKQLCEFFQVGDKAIKAAIKSGALKAFKISNEYRIYREDVATWIEGQQTK